MRLKGCGVSYVTSTEKAAVKVFAIVFLLGADHSTIQMRADKSL